MSEVLDALAAGELERYEERENRPYRFALDRRAFGRIFGSGLLFTAFAPPLAAAQDPARRARSRERISERVLFGMDGSVTVLSGKVEVGQGSRTQIAMAAAVSPDTMPASASSSTRSTGSPLPRACASRPKRSIH